LGGVDPSSFPIDFGLKSGEPGVSQDDFVLAQVSEEESHHSALLPGLH
jgi:hypothetical protein